MHPKPSYKDLEKKLASLEKALNKDLRETTTLLETVLDAIPDVLGVQDADHMIIRYNKAGYQILDMPPEQVHGKKCYELIGRRIPCEVCATTKTYQTKKPERIEKYVEEWNAWFDVRAYPILDESGKIIRVIEHLRDITREKHAEEALKESELKLKTILESIETGIVLIDAETYRIVEANPAAVEMLGTPVDQLVGKPCYHHICPYDKTACPIRDQRDTYNGECALIQSAGGETPVIKHVTRMVLNDRVFMLESLIDISERKRLEAQLYQSQKMEAVGTLAGGIAHDFNNLLMGIQGNASLMLLNKEPGDPDYDRLKNIEQYIQNGANLTKQLLGFAMGGKYETRTVNPNELVQKSADMFGRTKKEISVYQKHQPDVWTIDADRGQIEQVLLNLFVNAWQAMPGGGELYIETRNIFLEEDFVKSFEAKPGAYVKIAVTDTGVGIDPKIQDRIFDPFFTTKELGRGTGLGLASAYGIIRNHGGIITVESEKNQGSTFDIYLPASQKIMASKISSTESVLRGEGTVLIVDDEEMVTSVSKHLLESVGYRVLTADSGMAAVECIKHEKENIDIVILDMVMPGMTGEETFEQIKAVDPEIKVLLSSGYSMSGQAAEIMQKGCDGFIQKPFKLEKLSQKIREILSPS